MYGFLPARASFKAILFSALVIGLLISSPGPASAQLLAAKDGPIVYGHHHLFVSNVDAHRRFWVDTLGGSFLTLSSGVQAVKFPNVFLLFRLTAPSGGTKGTTVNHIGFSVPDVRKVLATVRANGYRVVTRDEVIAPQSITDDVAVTAGGSSVIFVMGPDDVKVEIIEVKTQTSPIALHHVHFFVPQNAEMQAWYAKVFGARPTAGGSQFVSATLPGVTLNFSPSTDPVVGTAGRAIDHIGFEVKNLETFTRKLEADGIPIKTSYRQVPKTNMFIAFITDPWGTQIELSEGLAAID
jgi:catechol 2,3-dioxygenase-like lactoylglutathione lyase family enzyme